MVQLKLIKKLLFPAGPTNRLASSSSSSPFKLPFFQFGAPSLQLHFIRRGDLRLHVEESSVFYYVQNTCWLNSANKFGSKEKSRPLSVRRRNKRCKGFMGVLGCC